MATGGAELQGKTAIITGGASGIGLAIARLFAARGASLVLLGQRAAVQEVAASLPGGATRHVGLHGDVAEPATAAAVVQAALDRTGRVDILVNNAGVSAVAPAESALLSDWDRILAVNLRGAFLMAQAAGRVMLRQGAGRIVNVASQAGVAALEDHAAYCSSKFGLIGLTKVLALEWGGRGITVNAVSPTVVETEMGLRVWTGQKAADMKAKIPTGRFASTEEVAQAILYLVGEHAGMVNGDNLILDGGYTTR